VHCKYQSNFYCKINKRQTATDESCTKQEENKRKAEIDRKRREKGSLVEVLASSEWITCLYVGEC